MREENHTNTVWDATGENKGRKGERICVLSGCLKTAVYNVWKILGFKMLGHNLLKFMKHRSSFQLRIQLVFKNTERWTFFRYVFMTNVISFVDIQELTAFI